MFKWLTRTELFSKNQGTACCAFVMACFQVGLMQQFFEDKGLTGAYRSNSSSSSGPNERTSRGRNVRTPRISSRQELLTKMKRAQTEKMSFEDLDYAKIRARREYSNSGTKNDNAWTAVT